MSAPSSHKLCGETLIFILQEGYLCCFPQTGSFLDHSILTLLSKGPEHKDLKSDIPICAEDDISLFTRQFKSEAAAALCSPPALLWFVPAGDDVAVLQAPRRAQGAVLRSQL